MSKATLDQGDGQAIPVVLKKDGQAVGGILRWCSNEPLPEVATETMCLFVYAWKNEGWTLHRKGEQA